MYVRGVSYYAQNSNVGVVIENPDHAFYTEHPIPFISTVEQLSKLEQKGTTIYCFLRKKEMDWLERMIKGRYVMTSLLESGERSLVKLEKV